MELPPLNKLPEQPRLLPQVLPQLHMFVSPLPFGLQYIVCGRGGVGAWIRDRRLGKRERVSGEVKEGQPPLHRQYSGRFYRYKYTLRTGNRSG